LKRLKVRYGTSLGLSVYRQVDVAVDLCTGVQTTFVDTFAVKLPIVLPARNTQEANPGGFEYGGAFVQSQREQFMLDPDDCLFAPRAGDWIIFNERRYDVENVTEYGTAFLVSARQDISSPTGPNNVVMTTTTAIDLAPTAEDE
jgi:hypothetical protein